MEYIHDRTSEAMRIELLGLFGRYLTEKQVTASKGLVDAFVEVEGEGTSFIPEIDYKYVRHLEVPRDFGLGVDMKVDKDFVNECRKSGLDNPVILAIKDEMVGYLEWEAKMIDSKLNDPKFVLHEGESIE